MDWLDFLAPQGTLKSLLQHHSSKASIFQHSAFFIVHLSHPYMTNGKNIALTRQTFVGKVMSLLFNMLSRLVIALKDFLLGRKAMTNLDSILKSRGITFWIKFHLVKAMVLSSSHAWIWYLDYKESWAPKNWCFWTVVLEKTLESPLDCKEIEPVHPKGDQSWIFIGRTDA